MFGVRPGLLVGLFCAILPACAPIPERIPTLFESQLPPTKLKPSSSESILELALSRADPVDRYVLYSSLLGLGRSADQFEALDSHLQRAIAEEDNPLNLALLSLWYGDNALYVGDNGSAIARYDVALEYAGYGAFMGRSLRSQILSQRAIALYRLGRWEDGIGDLSRAAAFADRIQALRLLRRGADMAEASGDERRAKALRAQAERAAIPRAESQSQAAASVGKGPGVPRPEVPSLEALRLLAPWEAGIPQRAGGVTAGPGAYLGYGLRGFARGSKRDPCGKGLTGYYYGIGSHSPGWIQGRDYYAVDFTRGRNEGSRIGNASFGIQLRSPGHGIVVESHYGTRTHWDAREPGPAPQANRVDILHILEGRESLLGATQGFDLDNRPRPPFGIRSVSLHLAGLESPCDASGCIDHPALVSFGQFLVRGTPIGYEDGSGLSMVDHLHFALMAPCNARDERCVEAEPPLPEVSIPLFIEGEALGSQDVGRCIVSSNHYELPSQGIDALGPWLRDSPSIESALDTATP